MGLPVLINEGAYLFWFESTQSVSSPQDSSHLCFGYKAWPKRHNSPDPLDSVINYIKFRIQNMTK